VCGSTDRLDHDGCVWLPSYFVLPAGPPFPPSSQSKAHPGCGVTLNTLRPSPARDTYYYSSLGMPLFQSQRRASNETGDPGRPIRRAPVTNGQCDGVEPWCGLFREPLSPSNPLVSAGTRKTTTVLGRREIDGSAICQTRSRGREKSWGAAKGFCDESGDPPPTPAMAGAVLHVPCMAGGEDTAPLWRRGYLYSTPARRRDFCAVGSQVASARLARRGGPSSCGAFPNRWDAGRGAAAAGHRLGLDWLDWIDWLDWLEPATESSLSPTLVEAALATQDRPPSAC